MRSSILKLSIQYEDTISFAEQLGKLHSKRKVFYPEEIQERVTLSHNFSTVDENTLLYAREKWRALICS